MKQTTPTQQRGSAIGKLLLAIAILLAIVFFMGYRADIPLQTLKDKYTNEQSRFVDVMGMSVHYRDEGQGPALVLLHGTAASLHTWDGWVDELKNDFRIIRFDMPAFGLTGPDPDGDYTIKHYVDFVDALTTKLGVEKFHLAGNSLGGEIAWGFALAYPDKVDKLILLDAAGYPRLAGQKESVAFKMARTPVLKSVLKKFTPRSLYKKSILEVYGDDSKVSEELIDRYLELSLREGNRQAFSERVITSQVKADGDISKISQPTLILWGEQDIWIPVAHGHHFAADIDGSKLIIYPGVGHVPMEELPVESASDARAFLLSTAPQTDSPVENLTGI